MGDEAQGLGVRLAGPAGEDGHREVDFTLWDHPGGRVVELSVLLTDRQVTALEEAAHGRGLTAAQLLRRILRRYLECERATDTG